MKLTINDPGFSVTVQDLGRTGFQRYGVSTSGAMDGYALMAVNHLVGNELNAAGLETALAGFSLVAEQDCLVAAGGKGFEFSIGGLSHPLWRAVQAKAGETIQLGVTDHLGWGYLAVHGGIAVPLVLGSRSTYLPAGWGGLEGRRLQAGDELWIATHVSENDAASQEGISLPEELIPDYPPEPCLRFIPATATLRINHQVLNQFQSTSYRVERPSRMANLLRGEPLSVEGNMDILSEGVGPGVIQLTGDGQPLVLMSDAQTTGGYAKLGSVISADLSLLAQCISQDGPIRFCATPLNIARDAWREKVSRLLAV